MTVTVFLFYFYVFEKEDNEGGKKIYYFLFFLETFCLLNFGFVKNLYIKFSFFGVVVVL